MSDQINPDILRAHDDGTRTCWYIHCGLPAGHGGDHKANLEGRSAALSTVPPVHTPATVRRVPNKPRTPITGFRIPEDVKAAAVARAEAEGKTLTEVVVASLKRYGKGKR